MSYLDPRGILDPSLHPDPGIAAWESLQRWGGESENTVYSIELGGTDVEVTRLNCIGYCFRIWVSEQKECSIPVKLRINGSVSFQGDRREQE